MLPVLPVLISSFADSAGNSSLGHGRLRESFLSVKCNICPFSTSITTNLKAMLKTAKNGTTMIEVSTAASISIVTSLGISSNFQLHAFFGRSAVTEESICRRRHRRLDWSCVRKVMRYVKGVYYGANTRNRSHRQSGCWLSGSGSFGFPYLVWTMKSYR